MASVSHLFYLSQKLANIHLQWKRELCINYVLARAMQKNGTIKNEKYITLKKYFVLFLSFNYAKAII